MIIWKGKEELETRENFPCRAFRWVLGVSKYGIELIHQHQHKDRLTWNYSHTLRYGITFTSEYMGFGSTHMYYDGTHCFLNLGWIVLQWVNQNCKKCMSD